MTPFETFERMLADTERGMISGLTSPARIQAFLDDIAYSTDDFYRCPLRVLRERTAHCFDGAVFAAAALRRLGHPPLILDLLSNGRDDEHLLALFKIDGHRNLRELAMSYFEQYYNIEREKTLRGYTGPLNLNRFDRFDWMTKDEPLDLIARRTDEIRRINLLPPALADRLSPVDERSYQAGLAGANPRGLFKPSQ